jgi:RND superfamily putative drug exporter
VNRFQLGKPATSDGGKAAALGRRVARRPVLATGLLLAALLALAAPSLASKTAAPDVAQLPPDNSERQAYETVRNAIGPGWMAVLDISVNSPSRPLTDPRMLDALDRYQSRIANLPDVELVVGPGALRRAESRIRRIPVRLADLSRQLKHGRRGARRLQSGLGRAKRGVQSVRTGIGAAANGASRIADGAHVAGDGGRQLATGSRRTHEGATILRDGLGLLAGGARRLSGGLARAHSGAQQLRSGSSDAGGGAQRLVDGLEEAGTGAAQLSDGATQLATGLDDGASGLAQLRQPAQVAQSELEKAYAGLNEMSVGKGDPKYVETLISVRKALAAVSGRDPATGAPVAPGYDGLDPALATAVSKLREGSVAAHRLAAGATELESGIVRLRDGATRLRDGLGTLGAGQDRLTTGLSRLYSGNQAGIEGVDRLYRGEGALAGALTRVSQGADHLSTGMSSLESALGTLAGGLTSGRSQSRPLAGGLALMGAAVQRFRTGLQSGDIKGFERIQRRLPGLFRSGYLPLAAVDGSRLQPRRLARVVLDYDKGGQTGRVLVTPRTSANDPRTGQLIARLTALTERFQRETGARAAVGGAPAEFADYVNAMAGSLPLLIGAIALLTFVGLVPIVRAIPLAFVAVLLNLLTVGAAVGVLTLAFVGANPPLGGPGAIDIVAVSAIFAITFALSIDYEVFLLSRMREEYARSGDPDAAVAHGLRGTAHVVTGAALIMVGVFSAFSLSSFVTISQFGVGLGTAVLLDATVVRLLLLPAIMRLLGKRAWWLPQWLDRAMPTFDVEGTARPPRLTPRPKLVGVAK